jgi:hypothetical protein
MDSYIQCKRSAVNDSIVLYSKRRIRFEAHKKAQTPRRPAPLNNAHVPCVRLGVEQRRSRANRARATTTTLNVTTRHLTTATRYTIYTCVTTKHARRGHTNRIVTPPYSPTSYSPTSADCAPRDGTRDLYNPPPHRDQLCIKSS